jgi:hypothetical protein
MRREVRFIFELLMYTQTIVISKLIILVYFYFKKNPGEEQVFSLVIYINSFTTHRLLQSTVHDMVNT